MSATTFDVRETIPAALVVSGELPGVSRTETVSHVRELFRRHTSFELEAHADPETLIATCKGEHHCMARKIRENTSLRNPRYLLIILVGSSAARGSRYSAALIDTDRAHELSDSNDAANLIVMRIEWQELTSIAAWGTKLDELVVHHWRPSLERLGLWMSSGELQIEANVAEASITLDGRMIGKTVEGTARLTGVPSGAHRVEVSAEGYSTFSAALDMRAGETLRSTALLIDLVPPAGERALFYGGLGVAAAGIAVLIYSATVDRDAVACWEGSAGCGGAREFATFAASSKGDDPNPRGVMIAPLGYSMILSGAILTIGSLLAKGEDLPLWLTTGASIAFGALSYGLSAAFNGATSSRE